jgi:hypothetical protein
VLVAPHRARAVAGVLAVAWVGGTAAADQRRDAGMAAAQRAAAWPAPGFSVSGRVTGLYPGRTRAVSLRVANRHRVAILVTSLTARVRDGRAGCPARSLLVVPFRGAVRVAPRRRARIGVLVRMRRSAPDACQGASFPLRFRGRAVRG